MFRTLQEITAKNTHRYDDIADTLYDAVKIGLIDQSVFGNRQQRQQTSRVVTELELHSQYLNRLREERLRL